MNGAGEEDAAFLGETESFAKTARIWFQNVRLDLIKKNEYPHLTVSFTNSGVTGISMRRKMCFSAAIVIERLTDSTCTRINAAHVIVAG